MQIPDKNAYWQLVMPYSHASLALNVPARTILQHLLFFFRIKLSKDFIF